MTKRELNRDIKRLYKQWQDRKDLSNEEQLKKELRRLWYADQQKNETTLQSLKMLLIINQSLRVITLHQIATWMTV